MRLSADKALAAAKAANEAADTAEKKARTASEASAQCAAEAKKNNDRSIWDAGKKARNARAAAADASSAQQKAHEQARQATDQMKFAQDPSTALAALVATTATAPAGKTAAAGFLDPLKDPFLRATSALLSLLKGTPSASTSTATPTPGSASAFGGPPPHPTVVAKHFPQIVVCLEAPAIILESLKQPGRAAEDEMIWAAIITVALRYPSSIPSLKDVLPWVTNKAQMYTNDKHYLAKINKTCNAIRDNSKYFANGSIPTTNDEFIRNVLATWDILI